MHRSVVGARRKQIRRDAARATPDHIKLRSSRDYAEGDGEGDGEAELPEPDPLPEPLPELFFEEDFLLDDDFFVVEPPL